MYVLELPRRGDSNKYTKHMFSWRIKWEYQWKHTQSADFCADQTDIITNFAVITNVVIKRVHCINGGTFLKVCHCSQKLILYIFYQFNIVEAPDFTSIKENCEYGLIKELDL